MPECQREGEKRRRRRYVGVSLFQACVEAQKPAPLNLNLTLYGEKFLCGEECGV